jgi:hypothetical protein
MDPIEFKSSLFRHRTLSHTFSVPNVFSASSSTLAVGPPPGRGVAPPFATASACCAIRNCFRLYNSVKLIEGIK